MFKRKIILGAFVIFLSLSASYAADDNLQDIVGKAASIPSRNLKAEDIEKDETFQKLFSVAGEELKPGEPKTNYFTAMKIAKDHNLGNVDEVLNKMGISDTYPINNSYTGQNKGEDAYNVWVGEREGKRLEGQAKQIGKEVEKGAKKVGNIFKGVL